MKIIQEEPPKLKTDYEVVAPAKLEYKKSRLNYSKAGYDPLLFQLRHLHN